jgi:hypothetical protein
MSVEYQKPEIDAQVFLRSEKLVKVAPITMQAYYPQQEES